VRPLLSRGIAVWSLVVFSMTTVPANAGLLPERVENAERVRIAAGTYQTLVCGVVDGDKSEVMAFGKLDNAGAIKPHNLPSRAIISKHRSPGSLPCASSRVPKTDRPSAFRQEEVL
jgi:hypothetical protein